jgi:hypothetical protein
MPSMPALQLPNRRPYRGRNPSATSRTSRSTLPDSASTWSGFSSVIVTPASLGEASSVRSAPAAAS